MLCRCAASVGGDWMPIFVRDAIIQDVHVVGAWLNCRHAMASKMCSRYIGSVVSQLGRWLGSLNLRESSVRSNNISC